MSKYTKEENKELVETLKGPIFPIQLVDTEVKQNT